MKKVIVTGLFLFALVYAGMSSVHAVYWLYILFFIYGVYAALTDGISSAWISRHCGKEERGTALGLYKSLSSICLMIASVIAGLLWVKISFTVALLYSAIGVFFVAFYFIFFVKERFKLKD
jgi:MFS family permease